MSTQDLMFYIFSAAAVIFSLMVVLSKNPIYSAFSLVLVFFCVAADFVLLNAHLIATLQIFVYAGAITVLFVFVIMLLNADVQGVDLAKGRKFQVGAGVLCAALVLVFIDGVTRGTVSSEKGIFTPEKITELGGNTRVLSELMFSNYVLPFELTSVLLLIGIVGTVSLAKRKLENVDERK